MTTTNGVRPDADPYAGIARPDDGEPSAEELLEDAVEAHPDGAGGILLLLHANHRATFDEVVLDYAQRLGRRPPADGSTAAGPRQLTEEEARVLKLAKARTRNEAKGYVTTGDVRGIMASVRGKDVNPTTAYRLLDRLVGEGHLYRVDRGAGRAAQYHYSG
jgi:hypothetical protein